ncbi:MAG: single-stranded DNA-binding protein [Firmicutes bacterium]|nr:single-stranded DNA-binding protein [Bacillota bacterium]
MFNRVILVGRLTKDPECRYTPSGKAVCSMRLAVDRGIPGGQSGSQEADFVNIVAWEKLAETCTNNLQKGRLILVEGRLQIRQYERDGMRREAAEVVATNVRFLDRPKEGVAPAPERVSEAAPMEETEDLGDLNLDDLPF